MSPTTGSGSAAKLRVAEVPRLVRTVAHLRPGQVWHRLRLSARRRVMESFPERLAQRYVRHSADCGLVRFADPGLARVAALRTAEEPLSKRLARADDVLAGRFRFLNRTEELGEAVAWHDPALHSGTRLWKTYLHEFPYAVDLALAARHTGDASYRARLFDLIDQWHEACPLGHPDFALDSWNARALAGRAIHWLVAGSILELSPETAEGRRLSAAIAVHALFLRDNLEVDLQGNHLLRNAVGLVFADAVLGGFPGGLALLEEQVEEQVLGDGCHFERTPLYHAVVLRDLLETKELLGPAAPVWLERAVERMGGFLRHLVGPSGRLPLLGDSWLGEVELEPLLAALPAGTSDPTDPEHHSGLVVLARGATRAVLRAGAHGPDHQLGHAHADLLSFDATHGGARVVADTGGALYDPGPERQRLRSTAAHNTVSVDDTEQIEAWGSFRVGRRGRAAVVSHGSSAAVAWCWARHDAYRWLRGRPIHQRLLAVGDGMILALDAVTGAGCHRLASYLHLHPEAEQLTVQILTQGGETARRRVPLFERFNLAESMAESVREDEGELPWVSAWLVLIGERWQGSGSLELRPEPEGVSASYREAARSLEAHWRYHQPDVAPEVTLQSSTEPHSEEDLR